MEFKKENFPSPADAITGAGLALSIYGATEIGTTRGVLLFGAGRMLDLADGAVARRTYSSRYGANADAVTDKIAVAYGMYEAFRQDAVPEAALAIIAINNVINTAANLYITRNGGEAASSKAGKHGMFGQNLAFGGLALGNAMGNHALEMAGWGATAISTPIATKASLGYTKQAIQVRRSKQRTNPDATRNHQRQRR